MDNSVWTMWRTNIVSNVTKTWIKCSPSQSLTKWPISRSKLACLVQAVHILQTLLGNWLRKCCNDNGYSRFWWVFTIWSRWMKTSTSEAVMFYGSYLWKSEGVTFSILAGSSSDADPSRCPLTVIYLPTQAFYAIGMQFVIAAVSLFKASRFDCFFGNTQDTIQRASQ